MTDKSKSTEEYAEGYIDLGSLKSEIQVEIHTFHAAQRWEGRRNPDPKLNIISFPAVVSKISNMHSAAAMDDPYADWYLLKVEGKLLVAQKRLEGIAKDIEKVFNKIPSHITVSDNLNQKPARYTLICFSPLGYQAAFLLTGYDELIRKIVLAKHIGLLNNETSKRYINFASSILRSFMVMVTTYKNAGVSRDDIAANNARAAQAQKIYGKLPPQAILEGTHRSIYAPKINVPKRLKSLDQPIKKKKVNSVNPETVNKVNERAE